MCGIAGIVIKDPNVVRKHEHYEHMANLLLLGIEHRGNRATGFVAHTPGGKDITLDKKDVAARKFIEDRLPIPEGANVWLGHTRYDTQGSPKDNENNHPVVCNSTFVTHNGSIRNDDALFTKHKETRGAEVDSIAIPMVLDKLGWGKADEALAEFKGPFAIAAIDPLKYPDKVLLAKGGWSPLFIHESDKFIIWASERDVIKDAWKVILGTPPKDKTFREFKNGEFAFVTKDGIDWQQFESTEDFTERRQRTQSGTTTGACGVRTHYTPEPRQTTQSHRHGRTLPDTRLEKGRNKEDVAALRAAGQATGRNFEVYSEGGYPKEFFAGVDYPYKWEFCEGCMTLMLDEDMQDTVSWGYICDDCYDVVLSKFGYKDADVDKSGALNPEEMDTLEEWAKMESEVHRAAIEKVAKDTLLEGDTIDFLIFRVPDTYLEKREDIKELATDLDDLYQETVAELWADFGVDNAQYLRAVRGESDSGVQSGHTSPGEKPRVPYINCKQHGQVFLATEDCSECRNIKIAGMQARDQEQARAGGSKHSGKPNLEITCCRVCKHATKFHMLNWAWCGKHYKTCNVCDAGIVAHCTAPNGDRLCHFCSRGQKGLIYDGIGGANLEALGIQVAERTTD